MSGAAATPPLEAVLAAVPPDLLSLVEVVRAAAKGRSLRVFLVGGPVRDLLLGVPIRDVDLLLEVEDAEALGRFAEQEAPRGVQVRSHSRFGTASWQQGDAVLDLSAPRRETYARPGALPKVAPGSLADDLARRDFTVNAIALELADRPVRHDPYDGLADLGARRLRVLHPGSFHDDPTRALRAARLGRRLGFRLERGTRNALRSALRDGAFGGVSGERLRRELEKAFDEAREGHAPVEVLKALDQWHVLSALEPGLVLPREAAAPLRRLGRALAEPPWRPGRLRAWAAGLAVWLAPLPAALRRRTLERLAVRGELAANVRGFGRDCDRWLRAIERSRGRGAVDAALQGIDEERLWALYASADPSARRRIARWAGEDRLRRAPVGGRDLQALGLEGAALGQALARVRAAYLDAAVANREEALALARELAQRGRARR